MTRIQTSLCAALLAFATLAAADPGASTDTGATTTSSPADPAPRHVQGTAVPGVLIFADYGIASFSGAPASSGSGFRLGGGYRFNEHVQAEAAYTSLSYEPSNMGNSPLWGSVSESLSADSYHAAVVGSIPVTEDNSLFAKAGVDYNSVNYSYTAVSCFLGLCGTPTTGSGSGSKTSPLFGIGWQGGSMPLKYRVQFESLGTVKVVTAYNNQPTKTYDIGIEVFSAGLVFYF